MIDRYIYVVTRELPKAFREETAKKLKELIHAEMSELDSTISEEERIAHVLRELGDPMLLANKYRGKERYLIGPRYFDKYFMVLKIVSLAIFIGISVAFGIATIFSLESLMEIVGDYMGSLLSAVTQGVVWVTGIFALLEYYEVSIETYEKEERWNPSLLPELPEEKTRISRGESIFSIIITTLILPLFFFSPNVIGFYYNVENQSRFLPLFNIEELTLFRMIIFIVFTLNILIELMKIVKGRWTFKLAATITVLNIASSSLLISALSNMKIWNNEVIIKLEQYTTISFDRIVIYTIALIIIVTIAESVSALYKGYKYGRE